MFGVIRTMFDKPDNIEELAVNLEKSMETDLSNPRFGDEVVSLASRLKNLIVTSETETSERIKVLSLLNRIKIRALSYGTTDSYRVFVSVDSISKDIFRF